MDVEAQLLQQLRTANDAWVAGRPHDVAGLYHPDVVFCGADGQPLIEGREMMVESYVVFAASAVLHDFQEYNHLVRVTGDTAILSYEVAVEFTLNEEDQPRAERARELLVFAKDGGQWGVVWREQMPLGQ